MSFNLLDQLSRQDIPEPPPKLRQSVRSQMNSTLVLLQVLDLLLRGMPFALLHFAKAVAGLLLFTLTGTYEPRTRDDARRD